ncbi:hypothetical protein LCGC14_1504420 [marine sediment metagenome]|uniref:Helix-hairpin-helix DNA-binding motif class 1 domain-containing protein n=1 Tax=marine sediment metagenome TaxID=412755 RepID=A0A0F9LIG2_9ZZZZ|nr:Holliday junction branch migration protein RuvA [Actinomycetota bacterium]
MIAQLRGQVIEKNDQNILLDVSGVGYLVELTTSSMSGQPPAGSETTVNTYLHVREDSWQLYGFSTIEEKKIFEKLISISGIGPKLAMSILSANTIDEFKKSIANEDVELLTTVPRLGSKNAKRIILELKDKLVMDDSDGTPYYNEAKQALKSLGYTDGQISKALNSCNGHGSGEELVKQALRILSNG